MPSIIYPQETGEPIRVDLRNPYLAALLAWLWPGLGHLYQRRTAKGLLFMICILSTYFFGLGLGQGRVVYASWKGGDYRWQYICQLAVGLPALPAVLQANLVNRGMDPLFVLCERYPEDYGRADVFDELEKKKVRLRFQRISPANQVEDYRGPVIKDGLMAPPAGPIREMENDVLGQWHFELKHFFELGTYFTVIAGLLNLMVIYDALVGPAILTPYQQKKLTPGNRAKDD